MRSLPEIRPRRPEGLRTWDHVLLLLNYLFLESREYRLYTKTQDLDWSTYWDLLNELEGTGTKEINILSLLLLSSLNSMIYSIIYILKIESQT